MMNLFPLPNWAPAFKRVPIPLQVLDAEYARGDGHFSYAYSQAALLGQHRGAAQPLRWLKRLNLSLCKPLLARHLSAVSQSVRF
jgi:hypothetical protein